MALPPAMTLSLAVFLPVMAKMGFQVSVMLERYGFYPAGGGAWQATIQPVKETYALDIRQRGALLSRLARVTDAQLPTHIARRELAQVKKQCGWSGAELQYRPVSSAGPGTLLSLQVESEHIIEMVEVVGEKRLSAEQVANRAIKALQAYLAAEVTIGSYLADQLLLPMALAKGGCFTTLAPTQHLLSNIEVIKQFMGIEIHVRQISSKVWQVSVATPKDKGGLIRKGPR